jgi:hypothetical protein
MEACMSWRATACLMLLCNAAFAQSVKPAPIKPAPPHAKRRIGSKLGQELALTATTLTASPNPSLLGSPVDLTATVASFGQVAPTGTVTFYDGALGLGSVTLINGTRTFCRR